MANEYNYKDTSEKLKKAIDYAKKNPNDPTSVELRRRLEAGQFNFELKQMGKKEFPIKRPPVDLKGIVSAAVGTNPSKTPNQSVVPKTRMGDLGGDIKEGFKEYTDALSSRGDASADRLRMMANPQTFGQGGFGVVAQGVGALIDTGMIAAKLLAKAALTQDQEDQFRRGLEKTMQNPALKSTADYINGTIADLEERDPILAKSLKDAMDLGEAFLPSSKVAVDSIKTGVELTKEGAEATMRRVGKLQPALEDAAEAVGSKLDTTLAGRREAKIAKKEAEVDEAVARIIQGKPEDVRAAKEALSQIDREGIETYEDLKDALAAREEALLKNQEDVLLAENEVFRADQLQKYEKVGNETVISTPVQDGLEQLKAFYEKTNNTRDAARIRQLETKLQNEGLTVNEINKIAQEHGLKLNAYNANGELASGLNKQAAENTRRGLKDVTRERTTGNAAKELDRQISNTIDTKELIEKMEIAAGKAEAKAKKIGILGRVGAVGGTAIDLLTAGSLKALIMKALPGYAKGSMNAVELQAELAKNLKALDDMEKIQNPTAYAIAFRKWMSTLQPGMSIRAVDPKAKELQSYIDSQTERLRILESQGKENSSQYKQITNQIHDAEDKIRKLETSFNQSEISPTKTTPDTLDKTPQNKEEVEAMGMSLDDIQTKIYSRLEDVDESSKILIPKESPKEKLLSNWADLTSENAPKLTSDEIQTLLKDESLPRPKKPTTLYRGTVPGENINGRPSSWTYLKEVAEEHAEVNGGEVVKKVINPDEIIVSLTDLPMSEQRKYGIIGDEEEVIVFIKE